MGKSKYNALKWREDTGKVSKIDVDSWVVNANPDDGVLTHPAGYVITLTLGKGKFAQVVLERKDLVDMIVRLNSKGM